jgi:hypothetical protein
MCGDGEFDEYKDDDDWVTDSDLVMRGDGECDEDKDDSDWVTDSDWVMSGDGAPLYHFLVHSEYFEDLSLHTIAGHLH